jgi:hypothetical protein
LPLVLVKNETSPRGVLGYVVKPLALYCWRFKSQQGL